MANTYDPDGKRTIGKHFPFCISLPLTIRPGVLTKPDRIPQGEENPWIRFIRNEREPLENNWFSVKQPSSLEIKNGITWTEARKSEEAFFAGKYPWSELDAIYRKYLGTEHLVERCSAVLSDLIAKRSALISSP